MPSRVLREGLLDSPRYWGARLEARDFFIRLLLVADDFGCVSLAPVFIARRCFNVRPGEAKLVKLYAELCRVDLIRIYLSGSPELPDRFAFIPRFRQTLRQMKARHPMPPPALYEDDHDAQAKFMQYKQLFAKMPSSRTTAALQMQRECSADLALDLDLETNPKRKEVDLEVPLPLVAAPGGAPSTPVFINEVQKIKGNGKGASKGPLALAIEMGLTQHEGEGPGAFRKRIEKEWEQRQAHSAGGA